MCVCCLMYIHVYIFINTALFNTDMYIYIYVCTKMYQYVMKNTDIAVLGHADGICHTYVDKTADLEMAVEIASDAKIQCVAVCCSVARVVAVCRILLQCVGIASDTKIQCVAVCSSVAHVVAVCRILLQCVESASDAKIQCVAVCCSVSHVVAVCRILLQCVVRAVTRCSVLQCGAVELASQDLQQ